MKCVKAIFHVKVFLVLRLYGSVFHVLRLREVVLHEIELEGSQLWIELSSPALRKKLCQIPNTVISYTPYNISHKLHQLLHESYKFTLIFNMTEAGI